MADNVENATFEILKSIQASIAQVRDEMRQFHEESTARFEHPDTGMRKDRRNVAGMLVMMRATAGDFDQPVSEVEERVTALEARA